MFKKTFPEVLSVNYFLMLDIMSQCIQEHDKRCCEEKEKKIISIIFNPGKPIEIGFPVYIFNGFC